MLKFLWIECLNNSCNHHRESLGFISGSLLNICQWDVTKIRQISVRHRWRRL